MIKSIGKTKTVKTAINGLILSNVKNEIIKVILEYIIDGTVPHIKPFIVEVSLVIRVKSPTL